MKAPMQEETGRPRGGSRPVCSARGLLQLLKVCGGDSNGEETVAGAGEFVWSAVVKIRRNRRRRRWAVSFSGELSAGRAVGFRRRLRDEDAEGLSLRANVGKRRPPQKAAATSISKEKLESRRKFEFGGADGVRTHDLLDAIEARSQLRHGPTGGTRLF